MGRTLYVLCICFLFAATTASARTLQQQGNGREAVGPPSALAETIKESKTKANVSLFVLA